MRKKISDPWNTHEINFGPTKYPREKNLDPRNRKIFGPTNYPQEKKLTNKIPTRKISDPQNIHEKTFWTHEIPARKNIWTHKILTRKQDPRNTHKKKFWTNKIPTKIRWYDGTRPTRTAMTHDPQNLKHSSSNDYIVRISPSQMFCKISVLQNSQKNNCARISFLIKLQVEKLLKNYKKTPEPKSLSK